MRCEATELDLQPQIDVVLDEGLDGVRPEKWLRRSFLRLLIPGAGPLQPLSSVILETRRFRESVWIGEILPIPSLVREARSAKYDRSGFNSTTFLGFSEGNR